VELTRFVAGIPGTPYFAWWIHAAVLAVITAIGAVLAVRNLGTTVRK
jgi:hypothetical protein